MVKKTSVTHAPYDPSGNLLHYPENSYGDRNPETGRWEVTPPEMRPNEPFEAAFQINGMHSGRSAKYVEWVNAEGCRYPMFVTDLLDLMNTGTITNGNTGPRTWVVRKRGQNYGIALAS